MPESELECTTRRGLYMADGVAEYEARYGAISDRELVEQARIDGRSPHGDRPCASFGPPAPSLCMALLLDSGALLALERNDRSDRRVSARDRWHSLQRL